jgi:GNAT acetyltransferase-like protein
VKVDLLDAMTDERRWLEYWHACGREPFAHPRYGTLFAGPGERAAALVAERGSGVALLPLIIRPIGDGARDGYDATSPYGYGGPFYAGDPDPDPAGLLDAVARWGAQAGLCSIFLRLSLDLGPLRPPATSGAEVAEVAEVADNVIVDLRRAPDDRWRHYAPSVRNKISKARRAGCTVRHADHFDDLDGFLDVYGSTMRRRDAAAWYHFDRAFLTRFGADLAGSYAVFTVHDPDGRPVSVELVLHSARYLYSFLGGTLAEAFPMAPNDLLKHEIAEYGRRTGRSGFVLGGGYRPDDGIFRYKRAFDPHGIRPFRVAKIIGDRDRYRRLAPAQAEPGYFPAYRRP